jgi:signal transduction histidine kinase
MESGELLLSLINDVLDLAKIEAGKEELVLEEVAVRDFIYSVLVLFRERAAKHGITVEINSTGVGEWILDGRKFKQILFNLLTNAFKFTPDGGKVGIKANVEGNMLVVTVWDTGIGICTEDMPRLFRPFEQLDSSLARRYPGTGLGLTMVKKLVELHGGAVSVESHPGEGSSFRVYFPSLTSSGTGRD